MPFCWFCHEAAHISPTQDFNSLIHYMEEFPPSRFLECMSDFHLLLYLTTTDMLPLKVNLMLTLKGTKYYNILDCNTACLYRHWRRTEFYSAIVHWAEACAAIDVVRTPF